ncbi:MAG: hypothetical protein HUJ68_07200, partial [Clostridia bacterium]|nr:hypothetical protein [Clostridia bacterium]
LAEKIPEDKFDEYKLDKTTPLIYAIKKKEIFSFGFKEYTRKQKDIHVPHSLPDYFGLTREEKTKNFMYYNPLPEDLDYTLYHMEHWENSVSEEEYLNFTALYGEEDDWEKQKKELEKIIEYFISRLKNFENQYIKQSWTSPEGDLELHLHMPLVIAAQCNDIFTAALLIEKGFELTPSFDEVGLYNETFGDKKFFLVNNFIYNLIYYKSWETLIWFLKEKKELAQTMMHNDKFNMNPLAFFAVKTRDYFIWTGKDKRDWRPLVQHIADLFINCGADPDEETVLGTARELMSFYKINM